MSKFNIDIDDLIQFFTEQGAIQSEGEGGFIIDGESINPVETLRSAFLTPVEIEDEGSFFENGVEIDLAQCFLDLPNMAAIDLSVPSKQIELDYGSTSEPQANYPIRPSSDLLVA